MGAIASQITSLIIVFSTIYLDTDQRKHQSSASLAFVRGIHQKPVNSPQMTSDLWGDRQQPVTSSWYYPIFLCVGDRSLSKMCITLLWKAMDSMDFTI